MTKYTPADEQRLLEIRKTIIVAIASDDVLMERLVLKGGNALDIVYELGERSSLDVDFSMKRGFEGGDELEEMQTRLFRALRDRFDSLGYVVFDERFEERPRPKPGQVAGTGLTVWGGYNATFKLIEKETDKKSRDELANRTRKKSGREPTEEELLRARRNQAQVTGAGSERVFYIEISKFEYTDGSVIRSVENYDCYVYTPAMIAAEKLRAICQQLPEYEQRKNPAPRPRDFFDIYTIAKGADCDITAPEHQALVTNMFAAKEVPMEFLSRIGTDSVRDFHAQEWPSVVNAVRGVTQPFDFYFAFVTNTANRLAVSLPSAETPNASPPAV